jgi:hypothetical protein
MYLIIDILAYSIDDFTLVCNHLYSCSRSMRKMVMKDYILIRNFLWDTHDFFGASLLPTHNYKTSKAAHQLLETILKRKCEEAKTVDYGLQILSDTVLHIANTEEFRWLLQPELKAIKDGLTFVGDKRASDENGSSFIYKGYVNAQGQLQGVGIRMFDEMNL